MKKFSKNTILLSVIAIFQIGWLTGIWLTGAASESQKPAILIIYSLVCFLVIAAAPGSLINPIKTFGIWLMQDKKRFLLFLGILFMSVGVYYAINQRIWTWDEEQNFKAARILAHSGFGVFFKRIYEIPWLAYQHPPLIPIINGLVMSLVGVNIVVSRVISLFFGLGTVYLTYLVAKDLYNEKTGFLAALSFIFFPLIIRISTAGLLDIQVTFFATASVWITLRLLKQPRWYWAILLGAAISAGVLTKYIHVFILPVLIAFIFICRKFASTWFYFAISFFLVGCAYVGWMLIASQNQLRVPGDQILQYLSSVNADQQVSQTPENADHLAEPNSSSGKIISLDGLSIRIGWFLFNSTGRRQLANIFITRLPSAVGAYSLPMILFGSLILLQRRSKSDLMTVSWLGIVGIILLLTLPDHRYFLITFPALAIMIAEGLQGKSLVPERLVLLVSLYWVGSLYLFIDWQRTSQLFLN